MSCIRCLRSCLCKPFIRTHSLYDYPRSSALSYIGIAVAFCQRYIRNTPLAIASLACLLLNPFVQDYLVIARGYSLALAFLMAALLVLFIAREIPERRIRLSALASVFVGLSISSNFSFGIVDVVSIGIFGALFAWDGLNRRSLTLGTALLAPAPIVAFLVCGPALTHFSKDELYYGTHSVLEMLGSVVTNTFYGPNPFLVNPDVMGVFLAFRFIAPFVILLMIIWALTMIIRNRLILHSIATPLLAIVMATIILQIAFALASNTPFPINRTVLFIAPLATLFLCLAVASLEITKLTQSATLLLGATAIFFLSSTRSYFQEWPFDSNLQPIYAALKQIERAAPSSSIGTDFLLAFSLNFYQATDPDADFPPIDNQVSDSHILPDGRDVYVLTAGEDDDFINRHKLKVVYSVPKEVGSNTVIAVRPSIAKPVLSLPPGQ